MRLESAVGGNGGKGVQPGIERKLRAAIGTKDFVLRAHLQIDMRMVLRRRLADA